VALHARHDSETTEGNEKRARRLVPETSQRRRDNRFLEIETLDSEAHVKLGRGTNTGDAPMLSNIFPSLSCNYL
jgi:hypothetical protein